MSTTNPPASHPPETMRVANHEALGKLIKSWSTGDASYTNGVLYPEPVTVQDLRDILEALGAGAEIPAGITKITLVRYGMNELVLRIPPAALIRAKEERLKQTTYEVPPFYTADPIEGTLPNATEEEKLRLQARRIGDYTIAHCE